MNLREKVLAAVHEVIEEETGKESPAIGICFTLPPEYNQVMFISNVSREDGITLFRETANRMQAEMN